MPIHSQPNIVVLRFFRIGFVARTVQQNIQVMPDDHSELEPPLPIPNRTVKRLHADDSADTRVKVGNRQAPLKNPLLHSSKGFLLCIRDLCGQCLEIRGSSGWPRFARRMKLQRRTCCCDLQPDRRAVHRLVGEPTVVAWRCAPAVVVSSSVLNRKGFGVRAPWLLLRVAKARSSAMRDLLQSTVPCLRSVLRRRHEVIILLDSHLFLA